MSLWTTRSSSSDFVVMTASVRKNVPFVQSTTNDPRPHVNLPSPPAPGLSFIDTQTGLHVVEDAVRIPGRTASGAPICWRAYVRPATENEAAVWEVLQS